MKQAPIETIKKLRDQTGAGLSDCKKALSQCNLNIQEATEWLKKQGLSQMAKRASKEASEGVVASYIHTGGRIGVMVEVNTETDFAARSEDFQKFVKHLTLHITAMNPLYISGKDISESTLAEQKNIFKEQFLKEKKSEKVLNKILEGRLKKWRQEVCLMDQIFFHPESGEEESTVEEALGELAIKVREKIVVRRFIRYDLGQIGS